MRLTNARVIAGALAASTLTGCVAAPVTYATPPEEEERVVQTFCGT